MTKYKRRYIYGVGRLSRLLFNGLRPVVGGNVAIFIAIFCQIFAVSPIGLLKVVFLGKRSVVFLLEGDRRFELLYKQDISGRVNFWLTKNILDQVSLECFKEWFNEFAGEQNHRYVDPLERYYHQRNVKNRERYKKYTDTVIHLCAKLNGDAVLLASADDTINFEIIRSVNEAPLKAVLFEREGTHSEVSAKKLAQMYLETSPLTLDALFCANANHLNCYRLSSEKEVTAQLIGELRTDLWINRYFDYSADYFEYAKRFRKVVVFLAFGEKNYLEPCFHPETEGDWRALSRSIEDELLAYLKENKDILLVYKMGHLEDFNLKVIERFRQECSDNFVSFGREFDCSALMSKADVVIGFQSTATLEALCYDVDVIYPFWNMPSDVDVETMILPLHNYGEVFDVISNAKDLGPTLDRLLRAEKPKLKSEAAERQRVALIERYFGIYDGKAADRAREGLIDVLDGQRKA